MINGWYVSCCERGRRRKILLYVELSVYVAKMCSSATVFKQSGHGLGFWLSNFLFYFVRSLHVSLRVLLYTSCLCLFPHLFFLFTCVLTVYQSPCIRACVFCQWYVSTRESHDKGSKVQNADRHVVHGDLSRKF